MPVIILDSNIKLESRPEIVAYNIPSNIYFRNSRERARYFTALLEEDWYRSSGGVSGDMEEHWSWDVEIDDGDNRSFNFHDGFSSGCFTFNQATGRAGGFLTTTIRCRIYDIPKMFSRIVKELSAKLSLSKDCIIRLSPYEFNHSMALFTPNILISGIKLSDVVNNNFKDVFRTNQYTSGESFISKAFDEV